MATLTSPNESCQYPLWPLIGPIFLGLPCRTSNSFYPGSPESILSFKSSPLAHLLLSSVCFYRQCFPMFAPSLYLPSTCQHWHLTLSGRSPFPAMDWHSFKFTTATSVSLVRHFLSSLASFFSFFFRCCLYHSARFQLPDANIQIQFPSLERLEIESRALATTTETEIRCKHDGRKTNNARWRSQQLARWEKMASGHGSALLCEPGTGDIC